jgi:hypothetical protein
LDAEKCASAAHVSKSLTIDIHPSYHFRSPSVLFYSLASIYESKRDPDVREERRPAAEPGIISPKDDSDLSLSLLTCPSESIEPSLDVPSPNLLPTWLFQQKQEQDDQFLFH